MLNTALLFSYCRNHHCFNHDHLKHQCPAFPAQSVLRDCHGLVHSRVLCFCLFCSHWVRSCQLLHQSPFTEGWKEGTDSSPAPCGCIKSHWTTGSWDCCGNCSLFYYCYPADRESKHNQGQHTKRPKQYVLNINYITRVAPRFTGWSWRKAFVDLCSKVLMFFHHPYLCWWTLGSQRRLENSA